MDNNNNIFITRLSANYESKFIEMMTVLLKNNDILDMFNNDMYIGGSLPSYVFSKMIKNEYDMTKIDCNDIDVYTSNYVTTLCALDKFLKPTKIETNGSVMNIHIDKQPIGLVQIMLANIGFPNKKNNHDAFLNEILGNYDTSLVKIGYHPFTKTIIVHKDFINDFARKKFYHKSTFSETILGIENANIPDHDKLKIVSALDSLSMHEGNVVERRNKKIYQRAKKWYNANVERIQDKSCSWTGESQYHCCYNEVASVYDFKYQGPYLESFHKK